MNGYVTNVERETLVNEDVRRVLYTGSNLPLVLMTLQPGEDIGSEFHEAHDQFIRIESKTTYSELMVTESNDTPLRPYAVYSPTTQSVGTAERRTPAAAAVGEGAGGH